MGIRSVAGSAAAALLLAGAAAAGTIEGVVALSAADLDLRGGDRPNTYVGHLGSSARSRGSAASAARGGSPADTAYAVAYLAGPEPPSIPATAPAATGMAPPATGSAPRVALLDQKGQKFAPRLLAVVAGQSVDFRNSDNVFHNVFSYSPPKRFDLGRYPRGKSKRLVFQKPGYVQIFCDIHSDMRADLVVVPNSRFAYVGASGRFRIENVPAGPQTIAVWTPRGGERRIDVTVAERGITPVSIAAE